MGVSSRALVLHVSVADLHDRFVPARWRGYSQPAGVSFGSHVFSYSAGWTDHARQRVSEAIFEAASVGSDRRRAGVLSDRARTLEEGADCRLSGGGAGQSGL